MQEQMVRLKKELTHALTDLSTKTEEAEETIHGHKALESRLTLRAHAAEIIKKAAVTRAQLSQHENSILHSMMTA